MNGDSQPCSVCGKEFFSHGSEICDKCRNTPQQSKGYSREQMRDCWDAGAAAVRELYQLSGKYLLGGTDVSEDKETYLASLPKDSEVPDVSADTFDWQVKLAGITGTVLGLRKVLMDYDVTPEKAKSIGNDLGKVSEEITGVLNLIKEHKK